MPVSQRDLLVPLVGKNVLYLEHLVEVLAQILDKVHVGEAGQHQVSGLLGEGHLGLREPCPVEGV